MHFESNEVLASRTPSAAEMKELWGFTPGELIDELIVRQEFSEALVDAHRPHEDPNSYLLECRSALLSEEDLARWQTRYGISPLDLRLAFRYHTGSEIDQAFLDNDEVSFRPAPATNWKSLCSHLGNDTYQKRGTQRPSILKKMLLRRSGINPMPLNAKFGTPVVKRKAVRRRPKAGCQPRTCARRIATEADDLCRQETLIGPMVMVCWKFFSTMHLRSCLAELRKTHICTLVPGSEQREDLASGLQRCSLPPD